MDFEFNLDEIDLANSSSEGMNEFTFEPSGQSGGGDNDPDRNNTAEDPLPGEELLNEPPAENATPDNNDEEAPKLEIELVDDEPQGEKPPLTAEVNRVVTPISKEDVDFTRLISNTQKGQAESEEDPLEMLKLEAEPEKGNMITAPVVIEGDDLDESTGEPGMDTVQTYISKLKQDMEEEFNSVEVEGLDEKLAHNKMDSPEYQEYLKLLKRHFKDLKSKKKADFEFTLNKDGSLTKTNIETKQTVKIKAPKYQNIKDNLKENKFRINRLLFSLDNTRRELLGGDHKNHAKFSSKFDKELSELKALFKENGELQELFNAIENIDKLQITNENIAQMKINQVGNFSRVKELINKKGDMGEKVEAIVSYLNLNNKILKSYEKTRKYYNVPPESYIISRNLPEIKKSKQGEEGDSELLQPSEELADASAWNPDSKKFKNLSPKSPPTPPGGFDDEHYSPKSPPTPPGGFDDDGHFSPKSPPTPPPTEVDEAKEKRKHFYSMFTKGDTIHPDEEKGAEKAPEGLEVEELDLGDDLMALQPNFDEDEDEEVGDDYRFNEKSKLTPEKQKEMEMSRKLDQAIPLGGESSDEGGEAPEDDGMSRKELNKIARQLNKPVEEDENIKVIELDTNLSFKPKTCDDTKTKRSNVKTTNIVNGKKKRQKEIDPELKNCMFPFKTVKGRGKKKVETYHNECLDNGVAPMCATERTEDCKVKKWAYCAPESK